MRKTWISLATAAAMLLSACGSVSGPAIADPDETNTPTESPDPSTSRPSTLPTQSGPVEPTTPTATTPPEEQRPGEAVSIDGSMSVALPDDWRYAPELETAYSVFAWTKDDGTQNLSMAPLGPWAQIASPEIYLEQLIAVGNLDGATAVLQGDYTVDGYDGFWIRVDGAGYVANIYYIDVEGGIKEITANAYHSHGLDEIDKLVQTIQFNEQ